MYYLRVNVSFIILGITGLIVEDASLTHHFMKPSHRMASKTMTHTRDEHMSPIWRCFGGHMFIVLTNCTRCNKSWCKFLDFPYARRIDWPADLTSFHLLKGEYRLQNLAHNSWFYIILFIQTMTAGAHCAQCREISLMCDFIRSASTRSGSPAAVIWMMDNFPREAAATGSLACFVVQLICQP